ncbi:MAG: iron-containing alcohol dehydrogenase [Clostridia bacterium]|nr:iron-containing alcohol dehydrogenase [Clostridia bacterium]
MASQALIAYCRTYQKVMKVATDVLPWKEPAITKGPGSIKKLPYLIKQKGIKNVLIVTDKGLMSLNLLDSLFEGLKEKGINYAVFDGVQPNPTIQNIEDARNLYIENNCEAIIAFGGGSPMDCAKAAGARVVKPNQSVPQMKGVLKVRKKLMPFFAVPTTAGTGSETTIAAVVSNPDTHEKYAINDLCLRPGYAILDPELTVGLPPHITSTTGMDALTHAVEAYIGGSNTKDTAARALQATKLIFDNIYTAYSDGKNIEARQNMLLASHYAGIAFTRAYVGYVHAIGHNLGGMYGVPHGLAMSILLPHVLEFYGEAAYDRLADLADAVGIAGANNAEKAQAFISAIKELNARMNIPTSVDKIKEEDIPLIAKRALQEGNPLYPVPKIMDQSECEAFIRTLMPRETAAAGPVPAPEKTEIKEEVKEEIKEAVEEVKEKAEEIKEEIKEKAEEIKEDFADALEGIKDEFKDA